MIAFAAAFAAVAAVVGAFVPWSADGGLAERVAWLERHGDEIDLLLVGSSNVRLGLDPARIDAELARRGVARRSFNLGVEGMNAFETRHLLQALLADPPARLRWVAIELLPARPESWIGVNRFSERVVAWHTPRRSAEVLEALRRNDGATGERLRLAGLHLQHAAWRALRVGAGPRIAASFLPADPDAQAATAARIAANRGFQPLGIFRRTRPPEAERAFRERWTQALRRMGTEPREVDVSRFDLAALHREVGFLRARGIEPIYVIPPVAAATPLLDALAARGEIPNLLAFNRPERFPALYRFEHRQDLAHVNARGARLWSVALAEALAPILAE